MFFNIPVFVFGSLLFCLFFSSGHPENVIVWGKAHCLRRLIGCLFCIAVIIKSVCPGVAPSIRTDKKPKKKRKKKVLCWYKIICCRKICLNTNIVPHNQLLFVRGSKGNAAAEPCDRKAAGSRRQSAREISERKIRV